MAPSQRLSSNLALIPWYVVRFMVKLSLLKNHLLNQS